MKIPIKYPGFEGRELVLHAENRHRRYKLMLDGRALVNQNDCYLVRNNNGDQIIIRIDDKPFVPDIFIEGEKFEINLELSKSDVSICLFPLLLCIGGPLWALAGIAFTGLGLGIYYSQLSQRIKFFLLWATIGLPLAGFLWFWRSLEHFSDIIGW